MNCLYPCPPTSLIVSGGFPETHRFPWHTHACFYVLGLEGPKIHFASPCSQRFSPDSLNLWMICRIDDEMFKLATFFCWALFWSFSIICRSIFGGMMGVCPSVLLRNFLALFKPNHVRELLPINLVNILPAVSFLVLITFVNTIPTFLRRCCNRI